MRNSNSLLVAAIITVFASGCSTFSSTPNEMYANVIQEELPNFVSGAEQLSCSVKVGIAGILGWDEESRSCQRNTELMVFAAQRIVKKFSDTQPNEELAKLVDETITVMKPLAESNYEIDCAYDLIKDGGTDACLVANKKVLGDKDYVLEDLWVALDKWQPYF